MKIIGIQVYGYGKLENLELGNLSPNLQLFFGQNEAGKSTLMSFIHSILFGFPMKQQNDQRYIPKTGTKYGGKLILQTNEYGTIVIERLPGKATGDVSIYFPDGTVKGEEFISELFLGMDKSLYQNVYSFNTHGLQGVHNLKSEDLGGLLFSAGTVGTDALLELQTKLSKEMDGLYKPKGKNPPLNVELLRLKEEHTKVAKWQEKNNEYEELLEEKKRIENELLYLDSRKHYIKNNINDSEKLQTIQPLLKEYQTLSNRLKILPVFEPFPEDGLNRLEQLHAQIKPYEAQLASLHEQSLKWKKQKQAIDLSTKYLELEQQITELVENKSLFNEKQTRYQALTREIQQVDDELKRLRDQIGFSLSEKDIFVLPLSIATKDEFSELVTEATRHKQQKHYLDDSFSQAKEALETSEQKLKTLHQQVLSEKERKHYEKMKNQHLVQDSLVKDKVLIEEELKRIDQKIHRVSTKESDNKSKLTRLFYGVSVALVIVSIYFYLSQEWLTGVIITIVALSMLPISKIVTSKMSSSYIQELHDDRERLLKELHSIQEELTQSNIKDDGEIVKILIRDQHVRQQIEIETATLQQNERAYDKVLKEFEEWEITGFSIDEKATNIKKTYGLPLQISNERLLDAFQILEAIREKAFSKQKLKDVGSVLQHELSDFQAKITSIAKEVGYEDQDDIHIDQIGLRLQEEKKKYEHFLQIEEKVKDTEDQISKLSLEIVHLKKEYRKLWEIAEVPGEEAYRVKGQANQAAKEIKERMDLLDAQFIRFGELVKKCNVEINYQQLIEEFSTEIDQLYASEKALQGQLSSINHRLKELEEGGTYADFLHSYGASKSLVKDYAKSWATLAVAKDILSKTVEQYRKLRLPKVIEKAERYFSILTEDRYKNIYLDNEADGFIVVDEKGLRYRPNELSQATSEQLYIALRFSLANTMHPNQSFPFIIDDSFVNFDSFRLASAISLIKELSRDNQVLLFTCHQHVLEGFGDAKPIFLSNEDTKEKLKSML